MKKKKKMKKWTKRVLVTVLSALFLLSCVSTAWATETNLERDTNSYFSKSGDTADSDITSFNLIKDYDSENPTDDSAPKSQSPAETVTYTIKPYGVWNAGSTYNNGTATKIDKTNMPMFTNYSGEGADRTYSVTSNLDLGDAKVPVDLDNCLNTDNKTPITLPTYATVGDYWYEVKETIGVNGKPTTGVTYGTNSTNDNTSNNGYNATYYLHVQVTETSTNTDTSTRVRNVTLHTTAPDTGDTDDTYNSKDNNYYNTNNKVNAIENLYSAGDLVIKKEVTGNAGDKTKYFPVTVIFTKAEGTIVNSDITFTAALKTTSGGKDVYTDTAVTIKGQYYDGSGSDANTIRWQKDSSNASANETGATTATAEFYVKDDTTVTFSNIPYGITYTVKEESGDYTPTYEFDNALENGDSVSGDNEKKATGSISDANDTLTITNNKTMTIDTGVFTENMPFVITFIVAGAALFLLIARKKRGFEG